MSEFAGISNFEYVYSPEEEINLETFKLVLRNWIEDPAGNDEGIAAFAEAVLHILKTNKEFSDLVENFIYYQTDIEVRHDAQIKVSASYLANLLYRSLQHLKLMQQDKRLMQILIETGDLEELPANQYSFPGDYTEAQPWIEDIGYILKSEYFEGQLRNNLEHRWIQTNHFFRYAILPVVINAEAHRFNGPVGLGDFGTSIGLGPKGLLMGEPHQHIDVLAPIADQPIGFTTHLMKDMAATEELNRIEATRIDYGQSFGLDLTGIRDPAQEKWVLSSFYRQELANRKFMSQVQRIIDHKDDRIKFGQVDLSDEESFDSLLATGAINKVDIVSIITMRHQLHPKEYDTVRRNAKKILSENGIIIEQEFLHPSIWPNWSYVAQTWDPKRQADPQIIALWKNARCNEVILPTYQSVFTSKN